MKVTFELPEATVRTLRARVENGKRSGLVADLLNKHFDGQGNALATAARKANTLKEVARDMKAWESLNGYDR